MKSSIRWAAFILVGLVSTATADRAFVGNRAGTTINIFSTTTDTEEASSPITVGTSPISLASDQADVNVPGKIFVVNNGSNTVSVVDPAAKVVTNTIDAAGSFYDGFDSPTGIVRCAGSGVGPTMAVVDSKVVSTGRSTIRFINPTTNSIVFQFRDPSSAARYFRAAFTSNGRLWITDTGDKGVVVVRLGELGVGPPWSVNDVLLYTGAGEFADFIFDNAATPTFLLNPQGIDTNGTDRVVVADGGSGKLTIINAKYPGNVESVAIVANVDLGLAAGKVCIDVRVANGKAYVTTTDPAKPIQVVSLTTNLVVATIVPALTTVGGIGRTSDGTKVYVGTGSGMSTISEISTATDTITATIAGLTGGSFPYGFQICGSTPAPPPSGGGFALPPPGPPGGRGNCGLLGLDALLVLGALALARGIRRR